MRTSSERTGVHLPYFEFGLAEKSNELCRCLAKTCSKKSLAAVVSLRGIRGPIGFCDVHRDPGACFKLPDFVSHRCNDLRPFGLGWHWLDILHFWRTVCALWKRRDDDGLRAARSPRAATRLNFTYWGANDAFPIRSSPGLHHRVGHSSTTIPRSFNC